jgi:DNA-binding PadR family transcriptional regulator
MTQHRRSPLAVVVLTLLAEEPMHAYRIQHLIKFRRKDTVANVSQRNSVYQTIDRLLRADLVRVHETGRAGTRPERTVYAITPEGTRTLHTWLRDMVSAPAREFPEFPAALASLAHVAPTEVAEWLDERTAVLRQQLNAGGSPGPGADLPAGGRVPRGRHPRGAGVDRERARGPARRPPHLGPPAATRTLRRPVRMP